MTRRTAAGPEAARTAVCYWRHPPSECDDSPSEFGFSTFMADRGPAWQRLRLGARAAAGALRQQRSGPDPSRLVIPAIGNREESAGRVAARLAAAGPGS